MQASLPWAPWFDNMHVSHGPVYEGQPILPHYRRDSTPPSFSRTRMFNEENPSDTSSRTITCSELESVACSESAPQLFQARKHDMTCSPFASDHEKNLNLLIRQETTSSITMSTYSSSSLHCPMHGISIKDDLHVLDPLLQLHLSRHLINRPKVEKHTELTNSECDGSEGYHTGDESITSVISDKKDLTVISSSKVDGFSKSLSVESSEWDHSDKNLNFQESPVYGSLDNKILMNKDQNFTLDSSSSNYSSCCGDASSEDNISVEDDCRSIASSSFSNYSGVDEEVNSDDDNLKDQGKMSPIEDDRWSFASLSSSNDSGFDEEVSSDVDSSEDQDKQSLQCFLLSEGFAIGEKSSSANNSSIDEDLRSSVSSSCSTDSGLGGEVYSSSNVEDDDRVRYWNEFQEVMFETISEKPKTKSVKKKKRKQLPAQPVIVPLSDLFQHSNFSKSSAGAHTSPVRKSPVSITSQQRSGSLTPSSNRVRMVEACSPVLLSLTPPLHWTKEKPKTCEITRERTYVAKRLFAADMFDMLAV